MLTRQGRKDMGKDETNDAPSNKEIWNLLLEIQNNIAKLLNDSKEHRRLNEEFKKSLEFEESKREELETKVYGLEKELRESRQVVKSLEESREENDQKLDDLEQYTRKYNLEISGVAMNANMTDREIVLAISKEIGVEMNNYDLDIVHRLRVKNGIEPIIIRFNSYQTKQRLYKAKKSCRGKDWSLVGRYLQRRRLGHIQ